MADVFISYKSERRRAAEHMAAVLERYGYSVWFDYQLIKGRDFGLEIDRKIREAKAVVVLWCTMSVGSIWVIEEAHLARNLGTFVPVKIEPCEPPLGFQLTDYVNLIDWDGGPLSYQVHPLIVALEKRIARPPMLDLNAMREYEAHWLRFGRPSLKKFALDRPIEVVEQDRGLPERPQHSEGGAVRQLRPDAGQAQCFKDHPAGPEMVVVPAGEFLMGSPEGKGRDDERPQHEVTIARPFAVGRFAVTFDEWDAAVAAKGVEQVPCDEGWGRGRRPVINVSWEDAQAYVAWLSQETRECYRLLSEAEWEYCCRAGTTTEYSFGDAIDQKQARFSLNRTAEVGTFPANAWGLYDMHGNVWEWCEDNYHPHYQGAPKDGSAWEQGDGSARVLRGGSWFDDRQFLRSADRGWVQPASLYDGVGFRVARTL
jgi:formylglycine-generating enzyme required for sulfatase activity